LKSELIPATHIEVDPADFGERLAVVRNHSNRIVAEPDVKDFGKQRSRVQVDRQSAGQWHRIRLRRIGAGHANKSKHGMV
jgi:hypothetical protein